MIKYQDGRGQTIDMGAHGTNKQQAMCSTHRDIWWPAWAHQQDRDSYVHDAQIYISSWPSETHQIEKLMECIVDVKMWMTSNFLLLNSEKTEVLIIGPKTPPKLIT